MRTSEAPDADVTTANQQHHNLLDLLSNLKKNVIAPAVNSLALEPVNTCSNIFNEISTLGTGAVNQVAGKDYRAIHTGKLTNMELGQVKAGSLASFSQQIFGTAGSFLTYAIAGKFAYKALGAATELAPIEFEVAGINLGSSLRAVAQSERVANVLGASAYAGAKDTKDGESHVSNAASTLVGFSMFEAGNRFMLSPGASALTQFGQRYVVGAAGGAAQSDITSLIQRNKFADTNQTFGASLSGGFLNAILPVGRRIAGGSEAPQSKNVRLESSALVNDQAPQAVSHFPPGTVEVFGDRVNTLIDERQSQFDAIEHQKIETGLKDQMTSIRTRLHSDLMFSRLNDQSEPMFLKSSEFEDEALMRSLVQHNPENARAYETYVTARSAKLALREKIDGELNERRSGIARIMNEESGNLFPEGALPRFKVARQAVDSHASASYSDGVVFLPDRDIDGTGKVMQQIFGDNFTGRILHEMKHGEQDGLVIRKHIDQVMKNDQTLRPLTDAEMETVLNLHRDGTGHSVRPTLVQEINTQRKGVRLSVDDLARADLIETGKLDSKRQSAPAQALRRRIELLEGELKLFAAGDNAVGPLLDDRLGLAQMFAGDIPESVQTLLKESEKQSNAEGLHELEPAFEDYASKILEQSFRGELTAAKALSAEHYSAYRSWAHERESWAVGDEADDRLGYDEQSKTKMMTNLLKAMAEPETFDLSVDMVSNPSNRDAFTHFENLYKNANIEEAGAYEVVLDCIAGEQGSLSDPDVARKLIDFMEGYAQSPSIPAEQAVFERLREYDFGAY